MPPKQSGLKQKQAREEELAVVPPMPRNVKPSVPAQGAWQKKIPAEDAGGTARPHEMPAWFKEPIAGIENEPSAQNQTQTQDPSQNDSGEGQEVSPSANEKAPPPDPTPSSTDTSPPLGTCEVVSALEARVPDSAGLFVRVRNEIKQCRLLRDAMGFTGVRYWDFPQDFRARVQSHYAELCEGLLWDAHLYERLHGLKPVWTASKCIEVIQRSLGFMAFIQALQETE